MFYVVKNYFRKKENFCSENFLDFQSADGEEMFEVMIF